MKHSRRAFVLRVAAGMLGLVSVQAETTYVVRKNDTLTGVAREYGITVSHLADHNRLPRDAKLRIGQKLVIPSPRGESAKTVLSVPIRRTILRAPVKSGRWKYIVIHHSATREGSVQGMDRYHREERHMENGLAYHFVIGNGHGMNDGEVAAGRRWREQLDGGHVASERLNHISLGICLVGNFERTIPTKAQMRSLRALIEALLARCDLSARAVKTHQQINPIYTICPGRNFPSDFIRSLGPRK